jgi:thiol-disulfide isomerase/thioredoxin
VKRNPKSEIRNPKRGAAIVVALLFGFSGAGRAADAPKLAGDLDAKGLAAAIAKDRGKVVVVNFWATWCVPCIRELPALQRFAREQAGEGWKVIALAVDQPVPVLEFIARFKLDLTVAMAGVEGLEWQRAMGNASGGLPFSVVLDRQGRARQRRLGESHYDELTRWAADIASSP